MCETNNVINDFFGVFIAEISKALPTEVEQKEFIVNLLEACNNNSSEKYDDDFYFSIIKPTISSLIRLKEDSAKEMRYLKDFIAEKQCSNEGTDYAVEIIEGLLEQIVDVLLDYDVQPFKCEDTKFNPRRQNVVKKLQAETAEQIKTVAESLSEGYERKGIVISKERVAAYSTDTADTNTN